MCMWSSGCIFNTEAALKLGALRARALAPLSQSLHRKLEPYDGALCLSCYHLLYRTGNKSRVSMVSPPGAAHRNSIFVSRTPGSY